ncbi:SDR family NAD(P)-dependent oxidoreductase [Deinococcus peraridilitoris]|uniref:Short-chain alcohol dehydrogenase like protein n=1 Tax=Deinococcus peraridilitoris (strain DSM 19664 / LMG 22246 / CIP 109416 / KR-200) TaxID=937777 RepID=L0A417_DEIPD|nr:SDR family oxidoreductase [Deinococcus peraridilitoris]AFZ67942.1 dehydrogenase of unknown specificity, short-chain alcohol dehydrogenase like protein [Deinococcus peraridilitoris DSM 19664]
MTSSQEQRRVTPLPEAQDYRGRGRLEGKIAIITGADSGIGQGTAIEFAREGADVAITYLHDGSGAERTRGEVEAAGRRALVVQLDQRDPGSVARLFEQVELELGTPFILVNNAAISGAQKSVVDLTPEEWDDAIKSDLYGPFYCCQHFIRARRRAGGRGKLINVTSVHEEIPSQGAGAYDAAKGAVRNLTRTLALELAADLINVNNIAPGMILTPMNQEAIDDPDKYAEQVQSIPLKRAGLPWEIGRLAVFLASDDADYVHGTTFTMDGGLEQQQGQGA